MPETDQAAVPRFSPRRVFWCFLAGTLLVQAAWILTLPTYRGSDEFDHVFKAESVARGQWLSRTPAPGGRGALVEIHEKTIRDATAVCEFYDYTTHANCHPADRPGDVPGDDLASVATSAGTYNPSYYVLVGWAARGVPGDAAVYLMRLLTALLCSVLIACGAALAAGWARTAWPLLALLTAFTPTFLFSTAIVAPNGVTYGGGLLVWMAILALDRRPDRARGAAIALLAGCAALVLSHTTGPMWFALIAATAVVLRPVREWRAILGPHPRLWLLTATGAAGLTAVSVGWKLVADANALGPAHEDFAEGFTPRQLLGQEALWLLQMIAAFPTRREFAPLHVYSLWLIILATLLLLLWRAASGRERFAVSCLLALALGVPAALTTVSYPAQGFAWQGRYSLPLVFGITALAMRALGRRGRAPSPLWLLTFLPMAAIAMATSTVMVGLREVHSGPASPLAAAIPAGFVLVGALSVAGTLLPALALRHSPNGLPVMAREATPPR